MLERLDAWAQSRDLRRDLAIVALYAAALTWAWYVIVVLGPRYTNGWLGVDAAAYYQAWTHDLYGAYGPTTRRYLYSPLFAQVVWPLTHLPFGLFVVLWSAACAAIFVWLLHPVRLLWRIPLLVLLCLDEVIVGNIRALLALALVLSFTRPGFWAVPLLTKPSTAIGMLYYPLTRQWRNLGVALAWTGGLVAVSFAISPQLWRDWIRYLTSGDVEPAFGLSNFVVRLAIALALVVVAARRREYWWLAVSMALASPVLMIPSEVSLLTAIPRLWVAGRQEAEEPPDAGSSAEPGDRDVGAADRDPDPGAAR